MHKRIIGLYCVITLLMTGIIYRVYFIGNSDYLVATATAQSIYPNNVATTRGNIYDRNLNGFVNGEYRYVASVMSTPQAAAALLPIVPEEEKQALLERLMDTKPFTMQVPTNNIYAHGVDIFRIPVRYSENQIAPHVIGYLSGDGQAGAAGIEKAYNEWLSEKGGNIKVKYTMNATGQVMQGAKVQVERQNENVTGGVVLTLDKDIQQFTKTALENGCEKGAAVVMDIYSGDILALVSTPTFDQNNISASLDSTDAPFINRGISGYNIGSIFKLVVAAAALENKIPTTYTYECKGYVDIDGQIFRCNNNAIHGATDMQRALEVSCNTYFINLAQQVGSEYLLALSQNIGIGKSSELAPGLSTQTGNLPTTAELKNDVAYANFSFGQGSSLATPLQMASAVATIANSGLQVTPRLVKGLTDDGIELSQRTPTYTAPQLISENTSKVLQKLMVKVVEEGSGKTARPAQGSAGGKTSSAQTGQYLGEGEALKEIVHAWFAGFYPAVSPKYSIVIFVEGGESGEKIAAPIFKSIANDIYLLNNGDGE